MNKLEEVARAIEIAQIGYNISLARLVDGVSTYECQIDGISGILEFDSHADALEFVIARRREVQARAAIEAMRTPTEAMEAAMRKAGAMYDAGYVNASQWTAGINAALSEGKEGE